MDIYGNNVKGLGGVFNVNEAIFTISYPGFAGATALVQSCAIQYSIEYRDIYELGSGNIYFATGRPTGQMTIGRIVGGQAMTFTTPCNPATITIGGNGGGSCGVANGVSYTLHNCLIKDYGVQVTVEDMMIRENVVFKFTHMTTASGTASIGGASGPSAGGPTAGTAGGIGSAVGSAVGNVLGGAINAAGQSLGASLGLSGR